MKPIVMDPVAARDEEEALFARDEAGQLIRVNRPDSGKAKS